MTTQSISTDPERYEFDEKPRYRFSLSRRAFMQSLGAGVVITAFARPAFAQEAMPGANPIGDRFHIGPDGTIVAATGKVEVGQGARTQISQAVAEEFHVPLSQVRLIMGDTDLVPNDGGTYGSQTTPRTIPTVRKAAAAARDLIVESACERWQVDPAGGTIADGVITHSSGKRMTLAEWVGAELALNAESRAEGEPTPRSEWKVMGQPALKVGGENVVTGKHRYTSDIKREGMLYGKVLRPPSFGARLLELDISAAEALEGVTVVRDGDFVGCTAPTSFQARKAVELFEAGAKWEEIEHPSYKDLFQILKNTANEGSGRSRSRVEQSGDVDAALANSTNVIRASYRVPYIQHAPMETRAAVAEWADGRLTVWTGTQRPFDVRDDVAEAMGVLASNVRLIMPDTGGGFGGKHTVDTAIEAARLARTAGRPVSVQWSRADEFTWAYCRPAGLLEIAAAFDAARKVTAFDFANYNSGGAGIGCPYTFPNKRTQFIPAESPLRQGSYRALAATANNFAREAFIDRLALEAGADPLAFRLGYLDDERLRNVLNAAADRFGWSTVPERGSSGTGYGIACGTEKGSFVATCAQVVVESGGFRVERIVIAFECGAIQNPANLPLQVEGCVVMGLGGALFEEVQFENGRLLNASFRKYRVPRFADVPKLELVLLDRPDLESVGAGETPIIAVAPAIANAIFHATGKPLEALPLSLV